MVISLYATTVLVWGLTWIAISLQLGTVPVEASIVYRFTLATLILFGWLLLRGRLQRLTGSDHFFSLLQGVCIFSLNFVCFYNATEYLASGVVSVVFSMATVMNALNGMIFFRKQPTARTLAGAAMGLIGICGLFWSDLSGEAVNQETLYGLLLALLGTYGFSLGNMISVRHQQRGLSPFSTNAYAMAYGAALLAAWAWLSGIEFTFEPTPHYIGALLFLAIPGSVIGFTAYLSLVGRIGPDKAAYATVLFPVVALTVSTLVEGYSWTPQALAGLVAVLGGNMLVFYRPQPVSSPAPTLPSR